MHDSVVEEATSVHTVLHLEYVDSFLGSVLIGETQEL